MDFDPTTEEGQADINDDDYDALFTEDESPRRFFDRMVDRFGGAWRRYMPSIRRMWQSRNPGQAAPPYLRLEHLNTVRGEMQSGLIDDLRERFPNVDLARIEVQAGDKGQIQVRHSGRSRWYDLYQRRDSTRLSSNLPKEIKGALGEEAQSFQMQAINNQLSEHQEELDQAQTEREGIQGQIETAAPEEAAGLRRELSEKDAEIARLKTTIDGALAERQRILQRTAVLEEQLRQRDQGIEDLERQIGEQREILNDSTRTEEEHAVAERELETLQERVTELQGQKDNLERELGLTTKEKIKRALLKYGVPLAFAVGIASAVGVIISMLKGTGSAVKKVGAGLANLGKKMAATIPGLLGSALSLVLRTGGELLKFVGNNIWVLVVALGAVLLKRLR